MFTEPVGELGRNAEVAGKFLEYVVGNRSSHKPECMSLR
jgi:hypothetical protein